MFVDAEPALVDLKPLDKEKYEKYVAELKGNTNKSSNDAIAALTEEAHEELKGLANQAIGSALENLDDNDFEGTGVLNLLESF